MLDLRTAQLAAGIEVLAGEIQHVSNKIPVLFRTLMQLSSSDNSLQARLLSGAQALGLNDRYAGAYLSF